MNTISYKKFLKAIAKRYNLRYVFVLEGHLKGIRDLTRMIEYCKEKENESNAGR